MLAGGGEIDSDTSKKAIVEMYSNASAAEQKQMDSDRKELISQLESLDADMQKGNIPHLIPRTHLLAAFISSSSSFSSSSSSFSFLLM